MYFQLIFYRNDIKNVSARVKLVDTVRQAIQVNVLYSDEVVT